MLLGMAFNFSPYAYCDALVKRIRTERRLLAYISERSKTLSQNVADTQQKQPLPVKIVDSTGVSWIGPISARATCHIAKAASLQTVS